MESKLVPLVVVVMIAAAAGLVAVAMVGGRGWNSAGMMGGGPSGSRTSISIDAAVGIAQQTAGGYSGRSLTVDEVMEFQNNFYASIREKDTGIGAFEVLINRYSGTVSPELGPNMMWNTAYGMLGRGGMMGSSVRPNTEMTVSRDRAGSIAQTWLDRNRSGTTVRPADPFHGYYTVDFERNGRIAGMLSVNGSSGQVWYHTWHGSFIQSKDLGK